MFHTRNKILSRLTFAPHSHQNIKYEMERIYVHVHTCINILFDIDIVPPIVLNSGTAPTTRDV